MRYFNEQTQESTYKVPFATRVWRPVTYAILAESLSFVVMRTLLETAPFPFLEPWEQVLILSWLLILSYYSVKHDTGDCYPLMLYLMDFCSKKTLQTFLGFFLKPTTGGLNPQVPQTVDDLVTPCYIGYLPVIQRNCERMLQRAHSLGCQLRPHMKTHKTIQGTWDKEGGNWWDMGCLFREKG